MRAVCATAKPNGSTNRSAPGEQKCRSFPEMQRVPAGFFDVQPILSISEQLFRHDHWMSDDAWNKR
jgi:hypothetical protein